MNPIPSLRFRRACSLSALMLIAGAGAAPLLQAATPTYSAPVVTASLSDYRTQSDALRAFDQAQFAAELKRLNLRKPTLPPAAKELGFDPNVDDAWFASPVGQAILASILSMQTPSGGWSKRTDMTQMRTPGMAYGREASYIPTFDNDATIIQLELLARAHDVTGKAQYKDAFLRGLDLVLAAQYPNGGWPQNYPLVGGYHDHITFNDSLFANILTLLHDLSQERFGTALLTPAQAARVDQALERGLNCVVQTQVVIDGKKTIWGAQHDATSLKPASARAYEMASLASAESVALLNLLMQLKAPTPEIVQAVHAAMSWYEATAIKQTEWIRGTNYLTKKADAPDMWARFYDLEHNQPVFGDRDGSVHREIGKISAERLEGYAWFTTGPNKMLKEYRQWAKTFPQPK